MGGKMIIKNIEILEMQIPLVKPFKTALRTVESVNDIIIKITTDVTISVNEIDEMVKDSVEAINQGFNILKIKVGKEGQKDIERIKEIRKAVGDKIILRVDANQGWSPKEAVKIIRSLEDKNLNIELVEQPVKHDDLEGMKFVTQNTYTKILADESVFSPHDAVKIL